RHEVLEVRIANDYPVVTEVVALALDLRARRLRCRLDQLVRLVEGAPELPRRLRLERDRRHAGGLQPELDLERHRGGREREEAIFLRLRELLPPEQDVPKAQAASRARVPSGRA